MSVHADLPPSGYAWWWNCPGVLQTQACPEVPGGPLADEGTEAHAISEAAVRSGRPWAEALEFRDLEVSPLARPRSNRERIVTLDKGQDNPYGPAIEMAVEYVRSRIKKNSRVFLERRVYPLGETGIGELCHGTADVIVVNGTEGEVIDLKFGAGMWVPADSMQLKIYSLGLAERCPELKTVTATIVQPRCPRPGEPEIRSVTYDANELRLDFAWELEGAVTATQKPDAPLNPGDHCRWCPRKARCPAQREAAMAMAAEDFLTRASPDEGPWTGEDYADILAQLDQIDSWAEGIRDDAKKLAIAGMTIPGYKVVRGNTFRQWRPEVVRDPGALLDAVGLETEEVYEEQVRMLSPAQFEKKLSKKQKEALSEYTHKPEGKLALAPETDKREPYTETQRKTVKEDFEL